MRMIYYPMNRTTLILCAFIFTSRIAAQNTCATALPVGVGTHALAGVDGAEVPAPICAPNGPGATHGEWYTYTAGEDQTVTITTDLFSNVGDDTRLHVYTGGCGALVCVAGSDDISGSNLLSEVILDVEQGVTYWIAFDDRWYAGAFNFRIIEMQQDAYFMQEPVPVSSGYTLCAVDMNADGMDDVVSVTSTLIEIAYQLAGGGFQVSEITTTAADHVPCWSMAAGDLDGNGYNDLLYACDGLTFMMANADGSAYTEISQPEYIFCQRSNMVDVNNDGLLDAFVCHDVAPNVYYLNNGNGTYTYQQGGLGDTPWGGNYGSIWTDYNNDGRVDMFVAKCGASPPDQLHRNNGDGTYAEVGMGLGLADDHQSWSSAWGDLDNDGDMDMLIGSSGSPQHKLMRNDDGLAFVDVTDGSGVDMHNGTSIEWVAHDFDNDGYLDVLGGALGFTSTGLLHNNGGLSFGLTSTVAANGPVADLNNDGFLDIVNYGALHMNRGNDNNYLKVLLQGTMSNANGIGARIEVSSPLGTQIRDVKSGDGFRYMSTLTAHFGLGQDQEVEQVVVRWPSGMVDVLQTPDINTTLVIEEGSTGTVRVDEIVGPQILIFPSPARDVVFVRAPGLAAGDLVRVLDVAGKEHMRARLGDGRLSIGHLASGVYTVETPSGAPPLQGRFIKE
jgi:ASPIC and UnbV/FG-GAP-like repeat